MGFTFLYGNQENLLYYFVLAALSDYNIIDVAEFQVFELILRPC